MKPGFRHLAPLLVAFSAAAPVPASAQAIVQPGEQATGLVLDSIVELERTATAADGAVAITYVRPDVVVPGDRVRITLNFNNRGRAPVTNLKLRNPIPDGLQFDGTSDVAGLSVSVDGGTNWGALADLKLTAADGTSRAANLADVTHVMWILPEPVAPAARGSVRFFTRVR